MSDSAAPSASDVANGLGLLRHAAVYPGHPAVIAVCVMRQFASLPAARAQEEGHNHATALESDAIPGAGGHVWAALDLLDHARILRWDAAQTFEEAARVWEKQLTGTPFERNLKEGQDQADRFRGAFVELFEKFDLGPAPTPISYADAAPGRSARLR